MTNLSDVDGYKFGSWNLQPVSTGNYKVSLYLFHPALNTALTEGYDGFARVPARPVANAELLIKGDILTTTTGQSDTHASFRVQLQKGENVKLEGRFLDKEGNPLCGAFYTFVRKLDESDPSPTVMEYVSGGS